MKLNKCKCGEKEYLQVLPKYNRLQVHCVNCGNQGFAMLTKEKAIEAWNKMAQIQVTIERPQNELE